MLLGRTIEISALLHYFGRTAATAVSLILGLSVYDTQCGAKMFRCTPRMRRVFFEPFVTRWIFDVEILIRLLSDRGQHDAGGSVVEVPVQRWSDCVRVPSTFFASIFTSARLAFRL